MQSTTTAPERQAGIPAAIQIFDDILFEAPRRKNRSKRATSILAKNSTESIDSSSSPLFRREDWTLFRNLSTFGQRAGVSQIIPTVVIKECVDNALIRLGVVDLGRFKTKMDFMSKTTAMGYQEATKKSPSCFRYLVL